MASFETRLTGSYSDDQGSTLPFTESLDEAIPYDPSEGLVERGIKERRPDRVLGLKITDSLAFFKNEFDSREHGHPPRHGPFRKSGLVYPFILLESKSEERGPGFEAIQRQSAFPLRECLRLQQKLQQASGQPLEPLVWFFSNQADEWRLSAAVVDNGKYKVYDLWINRLLDPSGALQLLLLVDLIADWARDIFRLQILSCLAGGRDRVLRFRESSTDTYASQRSMETLMPMDHQPPIQSSQNPLDPDIIWISPSVLAEKNDTQTSNASPRTISASRPPHPFLRWMGPSNMLSGPARDMTIRHANMIEFRFLHLRMPDDIQALSILLRSVTTEELQHVLVEAIVASLLDPLCGIRTTLSWIDQVRCLWVRAEPTSEDHAADVDVRALFQFRTYLRGSDWQLVREMTCISWTSGGIAALAHLSGDNSRLDGTSFPLNVSECASNRAAETITRLRFLAGKVSAAAAFASRTLYLDHSISKWMDSEAAWDQDCLFKALIVPHDQSVKSFLDVDSATLAVIQKRIPEALKSSLGLETHLTPTAKAVLLHCGPDRDHQGPKWCLMVVEEVDFMVDQAVGEMIACAVGHDEAYLFYSHQSGTLSLLGNAPVASLGDTRCIQQWLDHLL